MKLSPNHLEVIAAAVEATGMMKKALAKRAGISPQSFCAILRGDVRPGAKTLPAILEVLGLEMEIIIREKEPDRF